jgi:hypothetical protein
MRKFYIMLITVLCTAAVYAQDKKVIIVSANLPSADAIIQKFMDEIDGMEGISATHVILDDVVAGTVTYSNYDAAILTENGGSGNFAAYSTAGWPLPTVCLKAYSLYKGEHPLFTQVTGTNWYTSTKTTDLLPGIIDMVVKDNSDILSCFDKDEVIKWTNGYNTTIGTGASEAHIQSFDLKDAVNDQADIVSNSTALANNKYLVDNAEVPANLKTFLWKIEENSITKRMVTWGVHHEFLEHATDTFYLVLKNSLRWVLKMNPECPGNQNAIADVNIKPYQIYPNPVVNQLNINNAAPISYVDIFDMTGKMIQTVKNDKSQLLQINTTDLAKGAYLVRIGFTDGKIYTEKLIK